MAVPKQKDEAANCTGLVETLSYRGSVGGFLNFRRFLHGGTECLDRCGGIGAHHYGGHLLELVSTNRHPKSVAPLTVWIGGERNQHITIPGV